MVTGRGKTGARGIRIGNISLLADSIGGGMCVWRAVLAMGWIGGGESKEKIRELACQGSETKQTTLRVSQ